MKMKKLQFLLPVFALVLLWGCGGDDFKVSPVDQMIKTMDKEPVFTIILHDMDVEGSFSKSYKHQYKVITEKDSVPQEKLTEWYEVGEKFFTLHENNMGMEIAAKTPDGKLLKEAAPPGYSNYVGNTQYGSWKKNNDGTSFWEFYGKYALISHLLGGSRVYRTDYNTYRDYGRQGRPYYGRNKQYGTSGRLTKSQKPNFYSRRAAKVSASKMSFSQKMNQRIGRAKSGFGSRSSSRGK